MNSVVFFGSGPVAARALELLVKHQVVEAVITKPRALHHRGSVPVLELCGRLDLPTFTPTNKQELSELFKTTNLASKVGIVIDYGIIISLDVIKYFEHGIVNSHFSLLPRWRGADPISFAILEGDKKTGVSLMVIDEQMDTGKLITQRGMPILAADTTPSLTEKLILLSNELLLSYFARYVLGEIKPHIQPHPDRATYSRKLTKSDGFIEWQKPAEQIEREIRAYAGWPKSRTTLAGKEVAITDALVVTVQANPGKVVADKNRLIVHCGQDALQVLSLQPAGKKEMTAQEFLAGHRQLLS